MENLMPERMYTFIGLLALLIICALPVQAGTSTFTGVITGSEPTAYEVDDSACTAIEIIYHTYQTFTYTVTATGSYTYIDLSIAYAVDMQLTIYQSNYDPNNVLTNCVVKMDDGGSVNLTAGVTYVFVVQPLFNGDTGVWEYSMTGPGDVIALSLSSSSQGVERPVFTDGRINRYDFATPIVVYSTSDGQGLIIRDDNVRRDLLVVTAEEIAAVPAAPETNTVIASANGVELWRLTSGEFQVMALMDNGKIYVMIFSVIDSNSAYQSFEIE
jgi:hypothetical protein